MRQCWGPTAQGVRRADDENTEQEAKKDDSHRKDDSRRLGEGKRVPRRPPEEAMRAEPGGTRRGQPGGEGRDPSREHGGCSHRGRVEMRVPEARGRGRAWRGRGRGQDLQICRVLLPEGPASGSAFLQGTAACDAPRPPSSPIPTDCGHLGFSSGVTASRSPPVSPAPRGRNWTICSPRCCPGLAQALPRTHKLPVYVW